jgi:hypothetical protein
MRLIKRLKSKTNYCEKDMYELLIGFILGCGFSRWYWRNEINNIRRD